MSDSTQHHSENTPVQEEIPSTVTDQPQQTSDTLAILRHPDLQHPDLQIDEAHIQKIEKAWEKHSNNENITDIAIDEALSSVRHIQEKLEKQTDHNEKAHQKNLINRSLALNLLWIASGAVIAGLALASGGSLVLGAAITGIVYSAIDFGLRIYDEKRHANNTKSLPHNKQEKKLIHNKIKFTACIIGATCAAGLLSVLFLPAEVPILVGVMVGISLLTSVVLMAKSCQEYNSKHQMHSEKHENMGTAKNLLTQLSNQLEPLKSRQIQPKQPLANPTSTRPSSEECSADDAENKSETNPPTAHL